MIPREAPTGVSGELPMLAAVVGVRRALVVHFKKMLRCSRGRPTVGRILRRAVVVAACDERCEHRHARIARLRLLLRGSSLRVRAALVALLHARTRAATAAVHPEAELRLSWAWGKEMCGAGRPADGSRVARGGVPL